MIPQSRAQEISARRPPRTRTNAASATPGLLPRERRSRSLLEPAARASGLPPSVPASTSARGSGRCATRSPQRRDPSTARSAQHRRPSVIVCLARPTSDSRRDSPGDRPSHDRPRSHGPLRQSVASSRAHLARAPSPPRPDHARALALCTQPSPRRNLAPTIHQLLASRNSPSRSPIAPAPAGRKPGEPRARAGGCGHSWAPRRCGEFMGVHDAGARDRRIGMSRVHRNEPPPRRSIASQTGLRAALRAREADEARLCGR